MPITVPCPCGKQLRVKDEAAGRHINCPGCGASLAVPAPRDANAQESATAQIARSGQPATAKVQAIREGLLEGPRENAHPHAQAPEDANAAALNDVLERYFDRTYEYKVLTQKDRWFGGKFDPEQLEKALNSYAEEGWKVIACATANIPGWGGVREEMIILMERAQ